MAGQILFNSEEIYSIVESLSNSLEIVETDIKASLNSKFKVLEELELFTEGMTDLRKESENLYNIYKNFIEKLKAHDESLDNTENALENFVIESISSTYTNDKTSNGSGNVTYSGIVTDTINNKPTIKSNKIEEIIPTLNYTSEAKILSSWLKNGPQVANSLLLSLKNSGILLTFLKNLFKVEVETTNEPTEYSIEIQKILLEKFANNKENVLASLNEKSILSGIIYFKEVANDNKINISDLLLDDKYNSLFLSSIENIYNNTNLSESEISNEQIENVKSYINNLSSFLHVSPSTLMNDERYIEVIKQGANI